jgi:hypothetical protein
MIANVDYIFSQHDHTVRRAEANYALVSAPAPKKTKRLQRPPRRTLWQLLRRLAGPAAA